MLYKKKNNFGFFSVLFNSDAMLLIKDLLAVCSNVDPNLQENHVDVTNSVMRETINPNLIPRLSINSMNVPTLHFRAINTNVPVCKEERNGCMRRTSDTLVK